MKPWCVTIQMKAAEYVLSCCSDYFTVQRGSKFPFSDYYKVFLIKSNPYILWAKLMLI